MVVLESTDRTADSKEKAAEVCFNPGRLLLISRVSPSTPDTQPDSCTRSLWESRQAQVLRRAASAKYDIALDTLPVLRRRNQWVLIVK